MFETVSSILMIIFCVSWIVLMFKINGLIQEIIGKPRKEIDKMIRLEELKEKTRLENSVMVSCDHCNFSHRVYYEDLRSFPLFSEEKVYCAICHHTFDFSKVHKQFAELFESRLK